MCAMQIDPLANARLHARIASLEGTRWESTPLLDLLPAGCSPLAWLGFQRSMVGWGASAIWTGTGKEAIVEAGRWWEAICTRAQIDQAPAASQHLTAFASFGFAAHTPSTLIVPEVLIIDEGGARWAVSTGIDQAPDPLDLLPRVAHESPRLYQTVQTRIGRMTQDEWVESVATLIERLKAGDAAKAVMTRDMLIYADAPIDPRFLLKRLNELYPSTWRFAVDGLIGASPEMLASVTAGHLRSRVLAGTAPAGHGEELLGSSKNLREHRIAVESVTKALAPLVASLHKPGPPFVLDLPNVAHLATDVEATLGQLTLCEALAALHPTAAVCGTPREAALCLLQELETTERDRYSGPVGWMNTEGEGEFCIALRCGHLEEDDHALRVFAGAGIMPDSDPAEELIETRRKMQPLLEVFGLSTLP